ncbi:MAG: FAD-binding oxidoreductase [Nanoarchaeota archaeon]|nr:FAD-binding oxidoreductase [Nanoarchaeota archaeon]
MKFKGSKILMKAYETDASRFRAQVNAVVHPENIEEVCVEIVKNEGIVPRGAGTGFCGGVVPINKSDVVMDLSRLDGIEDYDAERGTVIVEAGVVLNDLNSFLRKFNREFAIDILSGRVATIGGMIATNAVGRRGIKYGRTSGHIKWIDVIDSGGLISRKGVTEMSDYIGMEGITGVVVRACLKTISLKTRSAELLKFMSFEGVLGRVQVLKRDSRISSIEFFDKQVSGYLGFSNAYHLFVEYEDPYTDAFETQEFNLEDNIFSGERYAELISRIDNIYSAVALEGYTRIEDPKVISDRWPELFEWLEHLEIPVFGSIGVGIMHPCFTLDLEQHIPEMVKLVKRLGGWISGAYGVGILKKGFVDINDKKILASVKARCDPENKFNMGKFI